MPAERTIGNYVLGPILGRGGMSEVRAARHRFLGDRVAIKLLRPHLAGDPESIAAFIAEATRNRAIDHPNVVRVIDFGSDGDDCYLVMELVEGESLAARLERTPRLDEARLRTLGAAIADGLAAAHDRGIVHRDLKPGNIMLGGDAPKIVDFGIARTFGGASATVTGSRVGTLAYMAPEQITGGLIAPCIDVWALGVILYEAVAGRLPFDDFANGRTPQLFEPPPRLATLAAVSPALESVIAACLDRDPGRRPPSMRAIADELRQPADQRVTEQLPPLLGRETQAVEIDLRDARAGANSAPPDSDRAQPSPVSAQRRAGPRVLAAIAAAAVAIAAAWALRAGAPQLAAPHATGSAAPRVPTTGMTLPQGTIGPSVSPLTADTTLPQAAGTAEAPPRASGATLLQATGASTTPPPAAGATLPPAAGATMSSSPLAAAQLAASVRADEPARNASSSPGSPSPSARFTVELRSAPAGARIIINGRPAGITPAKIALDAPASILVTRARYRSSRVRAERAGPIDVRLVPAHRTRRPVAGETLD